MAATACVKKKHVNVWDGVVQQDHPPRDTLVLHVFEGASVHDFFIASHRERSMNCPRILRVISRERYLLIASRQPKQASLTPEMQSFIARGCVANLSDVRGRAGPERPRLIQELSVKDTKPRMVYADRPLNQLCRRIRYTMEAVARVANVASEGCYQLSLDDSSSFHHILLHPAPWPLFG